MLIETLKNFSIPKKKNVIFVSPELSEWPILLIGNKCSTKNMPNRLEFRKELLTIARNYTLRITDSCQNNISENIIATGHQAIWHHCGIWSKNLTTCKFANAVDGNSVHLVLDHDICDTAMLLPKKDSERNWYLEKIGIEFGQKNIPLEFRPLPSKQHIKTFFDAVIKAYAGQFCTDIWSECIALKNKKISYFDNIADLITHLQAVLNTSLGLNMLYLPVSKFSDSNAFINFVISIILDADNFSTIYNDMVKRQINELKMNRRNTVQYLKLDKAKGLVELPFWLLLPDCKRTSLYVRSQKSGTIEFGTASTVLVNLDSVSLDGKAQQLKNTLQQLN
ncbi:MAG: hypothetical protein JSW07_13320, partial [bacterium]